MKNPNCDNDKCRSATGEVRVYPLGGGGNLILCRACWIHENSYRRSRVADGMEADAYPQENWETAEVYASA